MHGDTSGVWMIVLIVFVVVLIAFGMWWMSTPPNPPPTPPQPIPIPPTPPQPGPNPPPSNTPPPVPGLNERLTATLSSSEEVKAPVGINPMSPPTGNFSATLGATSDGAYMLRVNGGSVRNLTGPPTAAHIHMGARGQAGPILKTLQISPTMNGGTLKQLVWSSTDVTEPLTAQVFQALRSGMTYVNWHTDMNPDGEVRGQLQLITF